MPIVAQLAVPVGSGQGLSYLNAVSCAGTHACTMIGDVGGPAGLTGPDFADTWNGSAWKTTMLPAPPGADPELESISCASDQHCVAVGSVDAGHELEPYAAEETHGTWSDVTPSVAGPATLSSVSCVAQDACVAVGYRGSGAARRPLIERWNDGRWTTERVQVPSGSRVRGETELVSVSCTTAHRTRSAIGSCAAVGKYDHTTRLGANVGWFIESLGPTLPVQTGQ